MTKSNFKYNSGQAGGTLFKPSDKDTSYRPFDKQAASQPILDAFRKNTDVLTGNVKRTGDRFLITKQIEQANELATAKHNADVARINTNIKLEQFAKFSKGAQSLVQQGLQIYKDEQTKKGFAIGLKMSTEKAAQFREYQNNKEEWEKAKRGSQEWMAFEGWKALVNDGDPELANKFLNASGWVKQAMMDALKGEVIQGIPKRFDDAFKTTKYRYGDVVQLLTGEDLKAFQKDLEDGKIKNEKGESVYDVAELNQLIDHNQLGEYLKSTYGDEVPLYLTGLNSIYRSRANGKIATDLLKAGYTTEEILTDFQPAIQLASDYKALEFKENHTKLTENSLYNLQHSQILSIFKMAGGLPGGFTTRRLDELVNNDWMRFGKEGDTEATKRSLSRTDKLEKIAKLYEDGDQTINEVEIATFLQGPLERGNAKAQPLSKLWQKELLAVDFNNRVAAETLKRSGHTKATLENRKKAFYAAAAAKTEIDGPLSMNDAFSYAKAGAAKGFGTEEDLLQGLVDKMPTDLGRSIDKWVEDMQSTHYANGGTPLDPAYYISIGVPRQVLEHEDIKPLLAKHAKHVIPYKEQVLIEEGLSKIYASLTSDYDGMKPLSGKQKWAGENAYHRMFTTAWKNVIQKEDFKDLSQKQLITEATNQVIKLLQNEDNRKGLEVLPTPFEKRSELRKQAAVELESGRPDQIVLSAIRAEAEWIRDVAMPNYYKAGGAPGTFFENFTGSELWPDPSQGGRLVHFMTPKIRDLAKQAKVNPFKLIRSTVKALDKELVQTPEALPGSSSEAWKGFYGVPDDIDLAFSKMFEMPTKKPERRNALYNTVQEKVEGEKTWFGRDKWKTVYKDNGKPLIQRLDLLNKPFNAMDPKYFFEEALGVAHEPWKLALDGMGIPPVTFYKNFLKQHGLKNADLFTPETQVHMMRILYNQHGPSLFGLEPETDDEQEQRDSWKPAIFEVPTIQDYLRGGSPYA